MKFDPSNEFSQKSKKAILLPMKMVVMWKYGANGKSSSLICIGSSR
jgi:hypothetical protein